MITTGEKTKKLWVKKKKGRMRRGKEEVFSQGKYFPQLFFKKKPWTKQQEDTQTKITEYPPLLDWQNTTILTKHYLVFKWWESMGDCMLKPGAFLSASVVWKRQFHKSASKFTRTSNKISVTRTANIAGHSRRRLGEKQLQDEKSNTAFNNFIPMSL